MADNQGKVNEGVTSFDKSKLKKCDTQEKNTLPTKESKYKKDVFLYQ